jgi:hypothetical protein
MCLWLVSHVLCCSCLSFSSSLDRIFHAHANACPHTDGRTDACINSSSLWVGVCIKFPVLSNHGDAVAERDKIILFATHSYFCQILHLILQTIPRIKGAVSTWRIAVQICLPNAAHRESNSLSPKHRFRMAPRSVPTPKIQKNKT